MDTKRGQALMELCVGLFALALVVSALCGFASYLVKSLVAQNAVRTGSSSRRDRVEIGDFAAKYVFGTNELVIHEKAELPPTTISR